MEPVDENLKPAKFFRCVQWLENQNIKPQRRSIRYRKNDFKDILQTNADRNRLPLSAENDETTLPTGVGEPANKPKDVPVVRLQQDNLAMECEWQNCRSYFSNYELFWKHVSGHISCVHKIQSKSSAIYACLWDVCGHKTQQLEEMVRHINYHAYHAKLLAIGLNGRATFKLGRCKKDSTKRNILPKLPCDHCCMWTGCDAKFNSIQMFFRHVSFHVQDSTNKMCSWAGCGVRYDRKFFLQQHVRSHTKEKLIACYHCGIHFHSYRKLRDHLLRQNVSSDSPFVCRMCGAKWASEYLLNEHARQHVSTHVCALCDMSAPSKGALAHHMRYRHLAPASSRFHACPDCTYRAVSRFDLGRHMQTHKKRKVASDEDLSEDNEDFKGYDSDEKPKKKKKEKRQYACHICPQKEMKIYSKGAILTKHLVKHHGAQWPSGHSRFRYQRSEDGMYRLTTTRYEVLEVYEKILDRDNGPKELLTNKFDFNLKQIAEPTDSTPRIFQITLENDSVQEIGEDAERNAMADVRDGDEVGISNETSKGSSKTLNNLAKDKICDGEVKSKNKPVKKRSKTVDDSVENKVCDNAASTQNNIEITMCDVDEYGNVINSEVMYS